MALARACRVSVILDPIVKPGTQHGVLARAPS
jgi:hypothetical protein